MYKDKNKEREYQNQWYKNNKQKVIKQRQIQRQKRKMWLLEFKTSLRCSKCGENHIACLDFHHRNKDKKEFNISHGIAKGWSKERIKKEIEKCDILCANCNRKHHWEEDYIDLKTSVQKYNDNRKYNGINHDECRVCSINRSEKTFYKNKRICIECYNNEQKKKMQNRRLLNKHGS